MSHIVIAAGIFPPDAGGPATFGHTLASYLAEQGEKVKVVCFSDEIIPETQGAFTVIRVKRGNKIISHIRYVLALWSVCHGARVIYAQNPIAGGWQSVIVGGMWGIPVVQKITGDYAWEQACVQYGYRESIDRFQSETSLPMRIKLMRALQRWVVRRAAKVIVPSRYLAEFALRWGVDQPDIQVIVNAFTPSRVQPLSWSERDLTVISVGRMVPWKRYDQLIDCWPEVSARVPQARLVLIGDGPEFETLKQRVATQSSISLVGKLPHDQVLESLNQARVFVLNSLYEGLSHVLLEALNAGCVPVATDVGGNNEVIDSGVHGLLVSSDDRSALVDALVRALTDESLAASVESHSDSRLAQFAPAIVLAQTKDLLTSFHDR